MAEASAPTGPAESSVHDHCPEHPRFDIECVECRRGRIEHPLRFHDCHRAVTPCCGKVVLVTNSPSMVEEARAYGVDESEMPVLVHPIEAHFQGMRNQVFPTRCACGKWAFLFSDVVNRAELERWNTELKRYFGAAGHEGPKPRVRDITVGEGEFVARVLSEKNQYVRIGLVNKVVAQGIRLNWDIVPKAEPRLVVGLDLTETGSTSPSGAAPRDAPPRRR
jgi:hypothetical protein